MGKQGLCSNRCIQFLYLSITMFQKITVEGGLKLYDTYHNIVVNAIVENPEWQEEQKNTSRDNSTHGGL